MTVIAAGLGCGVGLVAVMVALRRDDPTTRERWLGHALWIVVVTYPVVFAVLDNRSVYLGPDARLVGEASLGAVNTAFSALVAVLCLGLLQSARGNGAGRRGALPQDLWWLLLVPLGIFVGVLAVVAVIHGAPGPALSVCLAGLVIVTLVVVAEEARLVLERLRWLFRALVVGSLALAVLLPSWAFVPYPHEGRALFGLGTRLIGVTPAPNYLALVAATLWFVELARSRCNGARVNWVWASLALATCVWAQGRTAFLVVILVGLFAIRLPRLDRLLYVLRGAALVGLAVMSVVVPGLLVLVPADSAGELNNLLTGRLVAWDVAATAVGEHWALGYGPDAFGDAFWQEYGSLAQGELYGNAHNQWLDVMASYGVAGALALAILVVALLVSGWRLRHVAGGISLMALVLLFAQFPFGTPMRIAGLSWNLLTLATVFAVLAGVRRSALHAPRRPAPLRAPEGARRAGGL